MFREGRLQLENSLKIYAHTECALRMHTEQLQKLYNASRQAA